MGEQSSPPHPTFILCDLCLCSIYLHMSATTVDDFYQILGCEKNASIEQIKACYRRLALVHHPDKGGDSEMFKTISRAYQVLVNPALKSRYDQSIPIAEEELISPLKVFSDVFNQWLSQNPIIELLMKDSCNDFIKLLNKYHTHPSVRAIIESLTHTKPPIVRDAVIGLSKKVYVTLDDVYLGKRYPHRFTITHEDLQLSNDYQIENPEIQINLPLEHEEVDLESELHIRCISNQTEYIQKVLTQLTIVVISRSNFYRYDDHDLVIYVDLTLAELINRPILEIKYLNGHVLRFKNPHNGNLHQFYRIKEIALPNMKIRKRGDVYLYLNLILSKQQQSMLLPLQQDPKGRIYELEMISPRFFYEPLSATESPQTYPIDTSVLL
jgi:DnaJ-class molecular chaperone